MSDAQKMALNVLMLGTNIAFLVFTWQHNLWGMGLTFAGVLALHLAKD